MPLSLEIWRQSRDGAGQVVALQRQVLQHLDVGGPGAGAGLLGAGQAHLAEQHVADLLGAAEIEGMAGELVGAPLRLHHLDAELVGEGAEPIGVDLDPGALHGGQHLRHGALQRLVDGEQALLLQAGLERVVEPQRHVCVFGGVGGGGLQLHLGEADLLLAGPRHLLERDGDVAEVELGQLVHAVVVHARVQHVGHQHGVLDGRHAHAVAAHHGHVVLGVLRHLEHGRVFHQRLQPFDGLLQPELGPVLALGEVEPCGGAVAEGNVGRLARGDRQGDAAEAGVGAGQGVGFGVEGDQAGFEGARGSRRPASPGPGCRHRSPGRSSPPRAQALREEPRARAGRPSRRRAAPAT